MKKCTKSARQRPPRSKRSARRRESRPVQGVLGIRELVRESLLSSVRDSVTQTAQQLVEDEIVELAGSAWSRKEDSPLRRGGSCGSRIFLEGEPLHIQRTRLRDWVSKSENPLKAVQALAAETRSTATSRVSWSAASAAAATRTRSVKSPTAWD